MSQIQIPKDWKLNQLRIKRNEIGSHFVNLQSRIFDHAFSGKLVN